MDTKTCSKCKQAKSLAEFCKRLQLLSPSCKSCLSAAGAKYRAIYPFRSVYSGMMARCYSRNCVAFKDYGARGITVCERWHDYENYSADMKALGPKPSPSHTLDRIDNNGNYEPGNVRWADHFRQGSNQRMKKVNRTGHVGVSLRPSGRWRARVSRLGKNHNLGGYSTKEEAAAACANFISGFNWDVAP